MKLFSFLSSKPKHLDKDIDLSVLENDLHSHLIPGVDDGSKSIEESIELIKGLKSFGFKKLITTPHLFYNSFPEGIGVLDTKLEELKKAVKENNIDIELEVGCELMLDDEVKQRIADKEIKAFSDNYLLFEIPMHNEVYGLENWLFELQLEGYNLIIAHPERYSYFFKNKKKIEEIRDRGVLMQLNTISLSGYYGKDVMENAQWMVENRLIDLIGSDCHGQRHIDALKNTLRNPYLKRLIDSGDLKNNTL